MNDEQRAAIAGFLDWLYDVSAFPPDDIPRHVMLAVYENWLRGPNDDGTVNAVIAEGIVIEMTCPFCDGEFRAEVEGPVLR